MSPVWRVQPLVTISATSTSGAGTGATFTLTSAAVGGANIITSAVGSGTSGQGYAVGDTVTFEADVLNPAFGIGTVWRFGVNIGI